MGARESIVYHSLTCCLAPLQVCDDEMSLPSYVWTHTMFKASRFSPSSAEYLVDEAKSIAWKEILAMKTLKGDPLVPKLHAVFERQFSLGETEFIAPSIVMEFINGETLVDYLFDPKTLWSTYFPDPSKDTAEGVNEKVNCVVRKAIGGVVHFANNGFDHGDYHFDNVMVLRENSDGCPDIKIIDWNNFKLIDSASLFKVVHDQLVFQLYYFANFLSAVQEATRCRASKVARAEIFESALASLGSRLVPVTLHPTFATRAFVAQLYNRWAIPDEAIDTAMRQSGRWLTALTETASKLTRAASVDRPVAKCIDYPTSYTPSGTELISFISERSSSFWKEYQREPSTTAAAAMNEQLNCIVKKFVKQLKSVFEYVQVFVKEGRIDGCPEVEISRKCETHLFSSNRLLCQILRELNTVSYATQKETRMNPVVLVPDEQVNEMLKSFYASHSTGDVQSMVKHYLQVDSTGWTTMLYDSVINIADRDSHTSDTLNEYARIKH